MTTSVNATPDTGIATDTGAAGDVAERSTMDRILDILAFLARFGLAAMWIYSGSTKLGNHMGVSQNIAAYEIFTLEWSQYLARVIGPLEIAGGLFLLLGIKIRAAGWVSISVLVMFILGLYSAHARGLEIDCGCFDPSAVQEPSNLLMVIARDVVLIAITLFMIWRPYKKLALYP